MLIDYDCPLGHHLHNQETTHCGEIACKCDCTLCVRRRAFWDQASASYFKVVGGPGDGANIRMSNLPTLIHDGDRAKFAQPDNRTRVSIYEKHGREIHYISSLDVYLFKGGPLDGRDYPIGQIPVGMTLLLVPQENDTYAVYDIIDNELVFSKIITAEEITPLTQGPGFSL